MGGWLRVREGGVSGWVVEGEGEGGREGSVGEWLRVREGGLSGWVGCTLGGKAGRQRGAGLLRMREGGRGEWWDELLGRGRKRGGGWVHCEVGGCIVLEGGPEEGDRWWG